MSLSPESMQAFLALAAHAVVEAICGAAGSAPQPPASEQETGGGAFVTLRHRGELAGCIGYTQAPPPLYSTVRDAARAAALRDGRFERLVPEQLRDVTIELSVLSALEPIEATDVEVGVHGLSFRLDDAEGLLLPQVAPDHGLDRETFLQAVCQKAGCAPDAWQQPRAELESFTVQAAEGFLSELTEIPS